MPSARSLIPSVLLAGACVACHDATTSPGAAFQEKYTPETRTYYIAAEPVDWNYMPSGYDSVFMRPLPSPWGDSLVYRKLRYTQYTGADFQTRTPQPEWLGLVGPIIRAVVGDTIKVVFRNLTDRPLSIHPHGVRYAPQDEGALYYPPRGGGDSVTAGGQYTYTWFAEPESGPHAGEPSSKVWLYHSHAVMTEEEMYRGLFGAIIITDPAHARPDATPDDVQREFVTLWMVINENFEEPPDAETEERNLRHSINGYMFGNLHGLTMNTGDRVRWYLLALGTEVDLHTPHWHGEKVEVEGRTYTDVVELLPASMKVGDMVADNPGVWLLHCHVADHMMAGMFTTFTIGTPQPGASPDLAAQLRGAGADAGWFPFHDRTRATHRH